MSKLVVYGFHSMLPKVLERRVLERDLQGHARAARADPRDGARLLERDLEVRALRRAPVSFRLAFSHGW